MLVCICFQLSICVRRQDRHAPNALHVVVLWAILEVRYNYKCYTTLTTTGRPLRAPVVVGMPVCAFAGAYQKSQVMPLSVLGGMAPGLLLTACWFCVLDWGSGARQVDGI